MRPFIVFFFFFFWTNKSCSRLLEINLSDFSFCLEDILYTGKKVTTIKSSQFNIKYICEIRNLIQKFLGIDDNGNAQNFVYFDFPRKSIEIHNFPKRDIINFHCLACANLYTMGSGKRDAAVSEYQNWTLRSFFKASGCASLISCGLPISKFNRFHIKIKLDLKLLFWGRGVWFSQLEYFWVCGSKREPGRELCPSDLNKIFDF